MESILESLSVLGRLGAAMDMVTQRVSTEIHALLQVTLDEVEERQVGSCPGADARAEQQRDDETPVKTVTIDAMGPPRHATILRDLFWTLYSKLAAVLEGHRVVYEVARWLSTVSHDSFSANSASRFPRNNHSSSAGHLETHPERGKTLSPQGLTLGPKSSQLLPHGRPRQRHGPTPHRPDQRGLARW
jgi:hypothetical protein